MPWTKLVLIAMISAAAVAPNLGETVQKTISKCRPHNDQEYLTVCTVGSIQTNLEKAVWIDIGTTPSPRPKAH